VPKARRSEARSKAPGWRAAEQVPQPRQGCRTGWIWPHPRNRRSVALSGLCCLGLLPGVALALHSGLYFLRTSGALDNT
jgi:hypothetical protein